MANTKRPTETGILNIYCIECSRMIEWRKEHLVCEDGFYDWRIVAGCGCGEVKDPEIQALARAAYDAASCDDLYRMQEASMETMIGHDLNCALNLMTREGRDEPGIAPCVA